MVFSAERMSRGGERNSQGTETNQESQKKIRPYHAFLTNRTANSFEEKGKVQKVHAYYYQHLVLHPFLRQSYYALLERRDDDYYTSYLLSYVDQKILQCYQFVQTRSFVSFRSIVIPITLVDIVKSWIEDRKWNFRRHFHVYNQHRGGEARKVRGQIKSLKRRYGSIMHFLQIGQQIVSKTKAKCRKCMPITISILCSILFCARPFMPTWREKWRRVLHFLPSLMLLKPQQISPPWKILGKFLENSRIATTGNFELSNENYDIKPGSGGGGGGGAATSSSKVRVKVRV